MPRRDSETYLPPMELQNVSREGVSRKKVSSDADLTPEQADMRAAQLFNRALELADIDSTFVARHLGVSESLVSRWRSPNYKETPSFSQMCRMPFTFQLGLHKALNEKHGFGRAALKELLDVVGLLAVNQ